MAAIAAASQGIRSPFAKAFADDALEREPKVFAEKRVDARIYCGVAVAQPKQHAKHRGVNTIRAEGAHQIHGKERKPAEDESANDDAQCLRCFRLHSKFFHLQQFDYYYISFTFSKFYFTRFI